MIGVTSWAERIVSTHGEIAQRPRLRRAVAATCAVVLAATGVADTYSGRDLSLAVAYLVPVVAATVLPRRTAGLACSVVSVLELLAADSLSTGGTRFAVAAVNDVLRFVIFLLVVALLSALHDSALSTRAANERGRQFLADAAHQLRTPLS